MRWLMDACPDSLSWQAWFVLCLVVVVLWAVAIAAATALFQASSRSAAVLSADEASRDLRQADRDAIEAMRRGDEGSGGQYSIKRVT